jgi:hypothetical protein
MKHYFHRFVTGRKGPASREKVRTECGLSEGMFTLLEIQRVKQENWRLKHALMAISNGEADPMLHAYKALRYERS